MTDSVNHIKAGGANAASPASHTAATTTQPPSNGSAQLGRPSSTIRHHDHDEGQNDISDGSDDDADSDQYAPGELEETLAAIRASQARLATTDPTTHYQDNLYMRVRGMRDLIRAGVISANVDDDGEAMQSGGGSSVGQRLIDVVPRRLWLPPEMGGVSDEELARELLPGRVAHSGPMTLDQIPATRRGAYGDGNSAYVGAASSSTTTTSGEAQRQARSQDQRRASASNSANSNANTTRRAASSGSRSTEPHALNSRDESLHAFTPLGMIPPEHGGPTDEEIAQALMPLGMIPPERGGPTDEEIAAAMFGLEPPARPRGAGGRGDSSGRGSGGSGGGRQNQKRARREGGGGRGGGPEEACVVM